MDSKYLPVEKWSPRVYADARDLLVEDQPVLIQGQIQKDEQSIKVLADTIIPIDKAEEIWTASIHFNIEISRADREILTELHDILLRHPGTCPAYLHLRSPDKTDSIIALPDRMKLRAGSSLRRDVNGFLGYNAVDTHCNAVTSSAGPNGAKRNSRKGRETYGRVSD